MTDRGATQGDGAVRPRIVVGVNESPAGEAALRWALAEARLRSAELTAVMAAGMPLTYYPLGWPTSTDDTDAILQGSRERLDTLVEQLAGEGIEPSAVQREVHIGAAAEVLIEAGVTADLLVVGTRGLHGVVRWLGSVSDQVVRHAACPVASIPDLEVAVDPAGPVVVGVDGSPNSMAALEWALEEARFRGVPLQAVGVWSLFDQHHSDGPERFDPSYDEEAARSFLASQVEKAVGPTAAAEIELVTECDLPAAGLVRAADAADAPMLVVGARGLGGFKGLLLGSVSHKVLVTSRRPVVVVHHADS